MSSFSPGLILILGALPVPFLRGTVRRAQIRNTDEIAVISQNTNSVIRSPA